MFDADGELLFEVVLAGTGAGEERGAVDPHPASINPPITAAGSRCSRVWAPTVPGRAVPRRRQGTRLAG